MPPDGVPWGALELLDLGYAWGDKCLEKLPYHDHIGGWAARHGMVGITMNYRLAKGQG